ncbi:helicase C-terminal domain-containing protein [Halalkalibacillus halophilus]|uniref:helicase C-terminal domain-containing protein n=1 Tax=Halalkalibacillus halophilus TaxID=392827 RepID=UPI00041B9A1C|nr:helicase C-terminal domain-containing protein [Halalkalibacillus halophilus]
MERFVVVDLETTGNAVKKDAEIIEVGIVVMEGKKIVNEYSSKVKPSKPIPSFITKLTGITNEDVKDAPRLEEIIPDILSLIEHHYFVAHHVQFDYEFLNHSLHKLGYLSLECPLIDTVELSRIFFPTADSYKLEDITAYLNIEHFSPHRALSDAFVTALLLEEVFKRIEMLPFETLTALEPLVADYNSDMEFIFSNYVEKKRQDPSNDSYIIKHGLAYLNMPENDHKVDPSENVTVLNEVMKKNSLGDQPFRSGQVELIHAIDQAFSNNANLVVEAGPGLGKTLSYLIPSLKHSLSSDSKVVISTHTLQLQSQVLSTDWLKLQSDLPATTSIAILKSPKHYVHMKRLRRLLNQYQQIKNYDVTLTLSILIVWLTETIAGDFDELQIPSRNESVMKYVSCEAFDDLEEDGSYYLHAFHKAEKANIIVVNHAFLVGNQLYEGKRIPTYEQVVIDEAHQFEQVVRKQNAQYISYVSIVHLLQDISKYIDSTLYEQAKINADEFFRSIHQAVLFLHGDEDHYSDLGKVQLLLDETYLNLMVAGEIKERLNELLLTIDEVVKRLLNRSSRSDYEEMVIQFVIKRLKQTKDIFTSFFILDDEKIRWVEIDQYGAKNAAIIHMEPLNGTKFIQEQLYPKSNSFIYLSASLKVNNSFEPFMEKVGLPLDTKALAIPSPYNYEQQTRIMIPSDLPDIVNNDLNVFTSHVSSFIHQFATQVHPKMMILFTSYDMLKQCYQQLKRFKALENSLIVAQGITTGSREKLKKFYENNDHVILLGTNSFWEGLDLRGDHKKVVCVVRLPFEAPNHPYIQSQRKYLEQNNQNVFKDLALPLAINRFKQAFGRIIRSEKDQGLFIIFDQRIMEKYYGKIFIKALPEAPVSYEDTDELLTHAKKWLT